MAASKPAASRRTPNLNFRPTAFLRNSQLQKQAEAMLTFSV